MVFNSNSKWVKLRVPANQIEIATMTMNSAAEHNTFRDERRLPTIERVSGGRQYSVDDGGALVHKLNEPSSLIIQRQFQLSSHDCTAVDTIYERQATQDDPIVHHGPGRCRQYPRGAKQRQHSVA
jgi:hypothetical protein